MTTHELSKEDIKALKSSLSFWQDDYDPVEDAEQHQLFGRAIRAMDMLLAAHEQEPSATLFKSGVSAKVIMIGSDLPDGYTDVFAHPAPSGTNQVDELVMLVKRLAHSLKKANPDSKLHLDAMDYLKRNALIGITDLLRVSHPAPSIPPAVPEGYALVPVDATRAMIDAARRVEEDGYDAMHKAMIAAAPKGINRE